MSIWTVLILAVGTFAIRYAGPMLRDRIVIAKRTEEFLNRAATVVLVALVVTSAIVVDGEWAGWALPAGVLVGGILAWRKASLAVVVIAAAATTALLRLAGIA